MAVVCLALNAAYLRFDPFRCREIVKDYATKLFEKHEHKDLNTNQYLLIKSLSEGTNYGKLPDNKPNMVEIIFLSGWDRGVACLILVVSSVFFISHAPLYAQDEACVALCEGIGMWVSWSLFTLFIVVSLWLIFIGRGVTTRMKDKLDRADREIPSGGQQEAHDMQGSLEGLRSASRTQVGEQAPQGSGTTPPC